MPLFTTDLVEYAELVHRILRDEPPPERIDAICFFGQTQENDQKSLKNIAERWKARGGEYDPAVLVGECERIERGNLVVRGSDAWIRDLEDAGVEENWIYPYPMSTKVPPSTDAEALGMVPVIKENGWTRLVITVPPLHAVRAFVSLVSACKKNGLDDVLIWSAPSETLAWDENVFHSGSMPSAPRVEQIPGEFAKVTAYCAKGDHLTAKEVLTYLQARRDLSQAQLLASS